MIFKQDEVIDTLARQPSHFLAMKNVCTSYRSKRPLFKNNSWLQLYFVDEKAKVDAAYRQSSSSQTRWGMRSAASRWIHLPTRRRVTGKAFLPEIHQMGSVTKFAWPMDYRLRGAMLQACHELRPKPKSIVELKEALQMIWDSLPQEPINKAVKSFTLWLKRCTKAGSGHFEHSKWLSVIQIQNVHCVALFCCFEQTFFSAQKSLSGHAKISLTSLCLRLNAAYW